MLKNVKGFGIATAIASTSFLIPSSVYAFGLVYDVSQFTATQGIAGSATSAAPINNAAFTGATPVGGFGFGGLFSQNFLLVGASPTDLTIPTDSLKNNNSVATSQELITLTAGDIVNPIGLSFRFGYNGNSSGNSLLSDNDNFSIALVNAGINGVADGFGSFITINAPTYSTTNAISTILTPLVPLLPGNYALVITVNENSDQFGRSTAAGFNNIQIAPVPFEFSPAIGVGLLGGLYGLNQLRKNRKKKANSVK